MTVSSLVLIALIGLAGSFGAASRYLLGRFVAERARSQFPLGTLIINISGALLIGLLFALTGRKLISSTLQSVLATGFLGGYTTFSTLCWEGVQLGRGGSVRGSLLYFGSTFALGLLAVIFGLIVGWVI